ncbi:MAG: hypothetical protein ACLFUS_17120 [Candidatus Sumerlaeia bacterium]
MSKPQLNWSERHGWWVLSICFHVIIFVFLVAHQAEAPRRNEKPSRPIQLRFVPAAVSSPREQTPTEPAEAENPRETEPMENISEASAAAAGIISELEPLEKDPTRELRQEVNEQEKRIQEILKSYGKSKQEVEELAESTRLKVDKRLMRFEMMDKAADFMVDSQTDLAGPVRTVVFDNVPDAAVREVFNRYGIRKTRGYVKPTGSRYLSGASSGGTTFNPVSEEGDYEVLVIPAAAQHHMMSLEQNWLVSHGYNTRTTQVESVEFGIEKRDDEWVLDILDIKVRPLASPLLGQ